MGLAEKTDTADFSRMSLSEQRGPKKESLIDDREGGAKEYSKKPIPIDEQSLIRLTKEDISPEQLSIIFYKLLLQKGGLKPQSTAVDKVVRLMFENSFYDELRVLAIEIEKGKLNPKDAEARLLFNLKKIIDQQQDKHNSDFKNYKEEIMQSDPNLSEFAANLKTKVEYPPIDYLVNTIKSLLSKLFTEDELFKNLLIHYFEQFAPKNNNNL